MILLLRAKLGLSDSFSKLPAGGAMAMSASGRISLQLRRISDALLSTGQGRLLLRAPYGREHVPPGVGALGRNNPDPGAPLPQIHGPRAPFFPPQERQHCQKCKEMLSFSPPSSTHLLGHNLAEGKIQIQLFDGHFWIRLDMQFISNLMEGKF